jgi:hypothetical protein
MDQRADSIKGAYELQAAQGIVSWLILISTCTTSSIEFQFRQFLPRGQIPQTARDNISILNGTYTRWCARQEKVTVLYVLNFPDALQ